MINVLCDQGFLMSAPGRSDAASDRAAPALDRYSPNWFPYTTQRDSDRPGGKCVCVDDMFNLALFSQVFPRTMSQLWVDVCLFVVHFGQLS